MRTGVCRTYITRHLILINSTIIAVTQYTHLVTSRIGLAGRPLDIAARQDRWVTPSSTGLAAVRQGKRKLTFSIPTLFIFSSDLHETDDRVLRQVTAFPGPWLRYWRHAVRDCARAACVWQIICQRVRVKPLPTEQRCSMNQPEWYWLGVVDNVCLSQEENTVDVDVRLNVWQIYSIIAPRRPIRTL